MRFVFTLIAWLVLPAALAAGEIAVTVYNQNLGVVNETRSLDFQKGTGRLALKDVPSGIDPASVRFNLTGTNHSVSILEQNYVYDLASVGGIYDRFIDKEIELIDEKGQLYSGTLLHYSNRDVTLEDKSGKIAMVDASHIIQVIFPELPEGLVTRPTLFWVYSSDFAGELEGIISYQTSGLAWEAEYVGVLDTGEENMGFSGWASIDNTSGKTYKDATLKLVAGDIHRAASRRVRAPKMLSADMEAGAGFEEKAFFEYHLYTLPRKATVADKEKKQISLFDPARATVSKAFLYRPDRDGTKIEVAIEFLNSTKTGLGMPLPAGRVRMFKADTDGSLILLGEDEIDHTPKDEKVKVVVGYAFDITGEHRTADQVRVSSTVEERVYEIELSNRKEEDVVVEVEKKLFGFWDVVQSSLEYTKKDAQTLLFSVPVKAGETNTVTYRVRYYHR